MLHINILIPEQVLQLQVLGFLVEAITRFVPSTLAVCSCVGDHERRHYDYIVSTYRVHTNHSVSSSNIYNWSYSIV